MTTTNTYGRQVVIPLTNKSGGSVAAGDVVIVDTGNNDAFTTTTTGAFTGGIGIAQETIANNAAGRVLVSGYAALVNVNASVTRGNFVKTHTVVKQGTDAGSSRVAGTFGIFLTGGTTPDAIIWQPDLGGGSGLSDPMTTRGDVIVRDASNVTARLALGGTGTFLGKSGSDIAYLTPPGTELDYVQITSSVSLTATTEGTAHTCITGTSQAYAAVPTLIDVFCPRVDCSTSGAVVVLLYDGATLIGRIGLMSGASLLHTLHASYRLTPTAATHQYIVKAYTTVTGASFGAGAGGTGVELPAFLRITKV